jgi:hypothetical protein
MDTYNYTCQYCGKEYKPNRRKKQKYCSNSCRTRAFQIRNPKLGSTVPQVEKKPESVKIDKISKAGVGNAFLGALLADGVQTLAKKVFENEDNTAVTKKDFKEMKELIINRFHPILNMAPNPFGNYPFYDSETKSVVYLKKVNHGI